MKNVIYLKNFVLDVLFPIKCLGCGKEFEGLEAKERWICKQCLEKIVMRKRQVCPFCEKDSDNGKTHHECQKKTFLSGVWVASEYSDDVISEAIHKLKFNFIKDISFPISKVVTKSILQVDEFSDFHDLILSEFSQDSGEEKIYKDDRKNEISETILIPVPLHKKRYNWRGFNQAFLLSEYISDEFHLRVNENLLIRQKNTKPQTKIKSMEKRRENIKGAFSVVENDFLKNKNVIIVDDVCTTSATLNECAKKLKSSGVKDVWGLVVARR
ncbi:MAG: ComF family protein [Candidatus Pacebacteria bacterium]|nr:ComF family protein [Candidatus Paceibacterota bacterium]